MIDFESFCRECLGYKDMNDEHVELCKALSLDKSKNKLILMPRYSFKSCIVTIAYSLFRIIRNPDIRILIYSDSATKAQSFLQGIKNHIVSTGESQFRKFFPGYETDPHTGKWNESQIIISKRTKEQVEPTVDTGGIESSKVGYHYDIIIFDDIVTDLNITTKAQMDKVYDCYKKSLSLLKPQGEVVVTGTRWAFGDTYGRIIKENKGDWKIHVRSAVDKNKDGKLLFESIGLTQDFFDRQLEQMGSYLWSCLYKNSPVDDSQAMFKYDQFTFYGEKVSLENLYVTCTVDPAGVGDDFTAITVVGTDKTMRMHVLAAVNKHLKPNEIVDEIFRLSYAYHFTKLGVETNFFKGLLETALQMRMEHERQNENFVPFGIEVFTASAKAGEGKNARIMSLQPFHERGDLLFPGKSVESLRGAFSELVYQMMEYTQSHKPIHDDLIDSLAYHTKIIRRGSGEAKKEYDENSIAYIVKKDIEKLREEARMLPRKYRRLPEPMFLN